MMADNEIRVAVLSDTHGLLRREAVAQLRGCSHILHAGDIIKESDLDELALYGSLFAVQGNNDVWYPWAKHLARTLRFQIGGVRFLMIHNHLYVPDDLEGVDAVVFGHTHCYSEEWIDGRLWLNPGSCGPDRFGGGVTMARLIIRNSKIAQVEKINLDEYLYPL